MAVMQTRAATKREKNAPPVKRQDAARAPFPSPSAMDGMNKLARSPP